MYGANDHTAYGFSGTPVLEAMEDAVDSSTVGSAALSVGVMVAVSAVFLALLRKSGFRAMIAVGRG